MRRRRTDMKHIFSLMMLSALCAWPALAIAAGQTAPAAAPPAAAAPEVVSRNGYSFFTPFFYGYPGYPAGAYGQYPNAPVNNAQFQNTPINTCAGGGCSYNAVASYGGCYIAQNGQSLRNVTGWDCRSYDGSVAAQSNCTPPASPVPCN